MSVSSSGMHDLVTVARHAKGSRPWASLARALVVGSELASFDGLAETLEGVRRSCGSEMPVQRDAGMWLRGCGSECVALDALIEAASAVESGILLGSEASIGKTALLATRLRGATA